MNTLLALDLGTFKSVACAYDRGTDPHVFCCHAATCGRQGDVIDL